jgi:hypothetical protein
MRTALGVALVLGPRLLRKPGLLCGSTMGRARPLWSSPLYSSTYNVPSFC